MNKQLRLQFTRIVSLGLALTLATPTLAETSATGAVPSIVPAATPPPQNQDRQQNNSSAAGMAAMASGMQGMMCMMMMMQAQKEQDPKQKQMMQMMAMMECSQAAASAANAAQNNQNAKQNTDPKAPAQPQLQLPKADTSTASGDNKDDKLSIPTTTPDFSSDSTALAKNDDTPNDSSGTDTGPDRKGGDDGTRPPESVPDAIKPPKPLPVIDSAKLGYDDTGKIAKDPPPTSPFYPPLGGTNYANAKAISAEDIANGAANANGQGVAAATAKKDKTDPGAPGETGGAADSESKPPGENNFDGLLSQLMGGGAAAEANNGSAAFNDVIMLPPKPETAKTNPNIFEYASWRYKKAAHEDGQIRTKAFQRPPPTTGPSLAELLKP